jgi:alpha-amylase
LLDAVINHTGPVTQEDSVYPDSWVVTSQKCTLIRTKLISIVLWLKIRYKTESNENVELQNFLIQSGKMKAEYSEVEELNVFFFAKTGYPPDA